MKERVHLCSGQSPGICIERDGGYLDNDDVWVLVVAREATEGDLEENHHLEEIGEELWSTVVQISHCPFCGEKLGEVGPGDVEFAHFDSSEWYTKRL